MSTLAVLDAAIYTALHALEHDGTPTDARPFARVCRGWLPINDTILQLLAPQTPGIILIWGRTKPQPVPGTETLLPEATQPESRSPEMWTALVVLEEPRDLDAAVQGATGSHGILTLLDAALAAVNGLVVEGTWQGRRVRVAEYGPHPTLSKHGSATVAELVIVAERATPHVVDAADPDAVPLEQIIGQNGPPTNTELDHSTIDFT